MKSNEIEVQRPLILKEAPIYISSDKAYILYLKSLLLWS